MMSSLATAQATSLLQDSKLGAHWDGQDTVFSVFAGRAERVTLCLFDAPDAPWETRRVDLERRHGSPGIWSTRLGDAPPGTLYGYRVDGTWDPCRGRFYNPAKLLIDPWARAVTGEPRADVSLLSFLPDSLLKSYHDSAAAMPKCVVVEPRVGAGDGAPRPPRPDVSWSDTVIYEAHVQAMTQLHPEVPEALRGTYLGLCSEPMLEHFRALGVTSIQLMPVHQAASETHLLALGKRNYWGYAPVSFFAPSAAYATRCDGGQVAEFRQMVDTLHAAGFEVLLDVVFNHTAEGGFFGPLYGPKGFDGGAFYRWSEGYFMDVTGTGNTLDIRSPVVIETVLDSLRYWVDEMGVDGFRFDLATTIGRDPHGFSAEAPIFKAIAGDPVLQGRKMVAEPWDLGLGGYQLGSFPPPWREWNDRFRDTARRFWRGEASGRLCSELATRLAGSQDFFDGRSPLASVNFITAHDGFTLTDLVSYNHKHNGANGEDNRDGRNENFSRNWGVEGPSDDRSILDKRARAKRNLMATMLLAQGVPIIAHGDEIGRSQQGNNNVYCQDNELSWMHWTERDETFFHFVAGLTRLRRRTPQLRLERFLTARDVHWRMADGRPLGGSDWQREDLQAFTLELTAPEASPLVLMINGSQHEVEHALPQGAWMLLVETARGLFEQPEAIGSYRLPALSLALLEQTRGG